MFVLLLALTGISSISFLVAAYRRTGDTFHPLVITMPMFLILYAFLPFELWNADVIFSYLTEEQLEFVQLVYLLGVVTFGIGCLVATGNRIERIATPFYIDHTARNRLIFCGVLIGSTGVISYLVGINNVGGFSAAYGQANGSGWSDYGYVRDAINWCVLAIVLVLTARTNQKTSKLKWWLYWGLCFFFALPFLLQGILGARRGPTFLIFSSIGFGWYLMRRKRPRLITLVAAGFMLGILLLFLVSNRGNIYLGSDFELQNSAFEYLEMDLGQNEASNEYIYGAGSVINKSITDEYYWGRRYLAIIFVRPIPRQLWPNKYEDVGVGELETNLGVGTESFIKTLGWAGTLGSSPGLMADMWIEFWWFYLIAVYIIGWAYGRAWRGACTGGVLATIIYILMASLTIFLVFQTLEAMLVRCLFMGIPAWVAWTWATKKRKSKSLIGILSRQQPRALTGKL